MTILASATAVSPSPASAFFARWTDHATWPEWSPDTEWVTLDGPVAQGATGTLKPTGGPKVRFTIAALETDREYTDLSRLPGARLTFRHTAAPSQGLTHLGVEVSIAGPLSWIWARIIGKGFAQSAPADLARLIRIVEAAGVASEA